MSRSNGIDSMFSEVGTAEKHFKAGSLYDEKLKTRWLNVAFFRNLKRCFGSWNT